ncbi:MAG TPA: nucleoside phosphorylase [Ktedonobacteraceae bacterium]|jgi:uridine phosphorylase
MSNVLSEKSSWPILREKYYHAPSLLTPENLLREARRQKGLAEGQVPEVCVLDPDGDLVDHLCATMGARPLPSWACYHTKLFTWQQNERTYGIIGRAVGAPFAVLVAEELFASGCKLLISITSAGQLVELGPTPYAILIERALRDEGTSYHYLPPSPYSYLDTSLREQIISQWDMESLPLYVGASWTTDAPFRETEVMVAWGREQGILAIEMEVAALYALAEAKQYPIVCFAYVTNQMAQIEGDFEKGLANGSHAALALIQRTVQHWLS